MINYQKETLLSYNIHKKPCAYPYPYPYLHILKIPCYIWPFHICILSAFGLGILSLDALRVRSGDTKGGGANKITQPSAAFRPRIGKKETQIKI